MDGVITILFWLLIGIVIGFVMAAPVDGQGAFRHGVFATGVLAALGGGFLLQIVGVPSNLSWIGAVIAASGLAFAGRSVTT